MTEAEHMTDVEATEYRDEQHAVACAQATATDKGPDCDPDGEHNKGVIRELGELGTGAIITEEALARMLGRCQVTLKRCVKRGELPPPVRLLGAPVWTAGAIVGHLSKRLEAAERDFQRDQRRLSENRP